MTTPGRKVNLRIAVILINGGLSKSEKINIIFNIPKLLIPRNSMIMKFHFDKTFETQRSSRTNWESVTVTFGLNQQLLGYNTDVFLITEGASVEIIGARKTLAYLRKYMP